MITRTLTLNINSAGVPPAPPPFPCRPLTATPPVLPYPFLRSTQLRGLLLVTNGSMTVETAQFQGATIPTNGLIQFLAQQGHFYGVSAVGPTSLTLSSPYTGVTGFSDAFQNVLAPATIAAVYSSSALDTAGVATNPLDPRRQRRAVNVDHILRFARRGPFTVTVALTGQRPAAVTLAGGSIDIAEVTDFLSRASAGSATASARSLSWNFRESLPVIPPICVAVGLLQRAHRPGATVDSPPTHLHSAELQRALDTGCLRAALRVTSPYALARRTFSPRSIRRGALTAGDEISFFLEESVEMQQPIDRKQLPVDRRHSRSMLSTAS